MPELRIVARVPSKKLKQEYQRSCQLLGTSMTRRLHLAMQATIRKAKTEFPNAFNLLSEDEEIIIEALECEHTTVFDVMMYCRFEKPRVLELLKGLIDRGHVRKVRGTEVDSYTLTRKSS